MAAYLFIEGRDWSTEGILRGGTSAIRMHSDYLTVGTRRADVGIADCLHWLTVPIAFNLLCTSSTEVGSSASKEEPEGGDGDKKAPHGELFEWIYLSILNVIPTLWCGC